MDFESIKYVIVGAGMYGATMAERIANDLGEQVIVLEERDHIAGNSWSSFDASTNIDVHHYGSHIFHTSQKHVWEYVNRFVEFNKYRHQVLTIHNGKPYLMPINLLTINSFYSMNMRPSEVANFLTREAARAQISENKNLEDVVVSQIGYPLYEAFIKGYTIKQWETDPRQLRPSIIQRLPIRHNYDNHYFSDTWEGIPLKGYGDMVSRMLSFKNIEVRLKVSFHDIKDQLSSETKIIYTGPIDRYFDYQFGELGWRTLDFEKECLHQKDYQGTTVVNYADENKPEMRTHEFKHYHPEIDYSNMQKTIVFHEKSRFAKKGDLPYYPIGTEKDQQVYKVYADHASFLRNVYFGGRLGEYRYYDMHQVIEKALLDFEEKIKKVS